MARVSNLALANVRVPRALAPTFPHPVPLSPGAPRPARGGLFAPWALAGPGKNWLGRGPPRVAGSAPPPRSRSRRSTSGARRDGGAHARRRRDRLCCRGAHRFASCASAAWKVCSYLESGSSRETLRPTRTTARGPLINVVSHSWTKSRIRTATTGFDVADAPFAFCTFTDEPMRRRRGAALRRSARVLFRFSAVATCLTVRTESGLWCIRARSPQLASRWHRRNHGVDLPFRDAILR